MLFRCPTCQRQFAEAGYCPFDRAQLHQVALAPAQATILSQAMPAQVGPSPTSSDPSANSTQIEQRRGTFPLTPSTPASSPPGTPIAVSPTQDVTAARRAAPHESDAPRVRVVSASDSQADALEVMRNARENEYDKLVGQTLDGRYFVEKKIGEGGMGVVFAAKHAVIERPLAIKVLKREVMRDTATIRRFVQEAKAASRIGHPNIVDVTDFGTTPDGMTYSVMEYVEGQTLGAAIRNSAPFPPLRAVKIAAQIARALGAAHDKGIVHRDLKPENVFLVDRDGRTDFVKIVDFGIAKVAPQPGSAAEPRLTRAGSVFGTPEYMAPEQAAGRSDTDGRVDIYALGVILYEMICGRVPHRGDSMVRTLAMQMLDPIEPPSKIRPDLQIPPELEHVIMNALAKKREQRYQTMGELMTALEKVHTVIGQSITGSPVYALTPLPPGADPSYGARTQIAPASQPPPTSQSQPPASQPPSRSSQPEARRARTPTSGRARHEPQFTASDKPPTFEHVIDEPERPRRGGGLALLIMLVLVLGGVGAAVVLMARKHGAGDEHLDAGIAKAPPAADAQHLETDAAVAMTTPDAAENAFAPDAQVEVIAPADAQDDIVVVRTDAGYRSYRRDAGPATALIPVTPNGRGTIMIQVLTKPEGANLYAGTTYRGPGGTSLEEPLNAKLDLRCHMQGYKDGTVQLVFDGKTEVTLCVLQRIKICINNIKNPFDDCELDPNKPIGTPPH